MPAASDTKPVRWLTYAIVLSTFGLITVGGLVTSHGVGMAVPDWPNTYGYNMFFFPVSQWVGGIFYEHSHRLVASAVGFLVTVLLIWLHGHKAQRFVRIVSVILAVLGALTCWRYPAKWQDGVFLIGTGVVGFIAGFLWPKCEPAPVWLRRCGWIAFVGVVVQGLLGGLRVTEMKDELGIFHATLAQLFFAFVCVLAVFHTPWWRNLAAGSERSISALKPFFIVTTFLILAQLVLGATMRHQHAGLAIPDFPKAYGAWWPDMSADAVAGYNQNRQELKGENPITSAQILLQMLHRLLAGVIFCAVAVCCGLTKRRCQWQSPVLKLAYFWMLLIMIQVFLGAATLWTGKSADVATSHVAVGALSLVTGTLLCVVTARLSAPAPAAASRALGNLSPAAVR